MERLRDFLHSLRHDWWTNSFSPRTRELIARSGAVAAILFGFVVIGEAHHAYFDRTNLPDAGPLLRFDLSSAGQVLDASGETLVELAHEERHVTEYKDIPAIVRQAVLATEDRNFFSHNGLDYSSIPRILTKVRPWKDGASAAPQGGSTITQQLVRGVFLQDMTSTERRDSLYSRSAMARGMALVIGNQNTNRILRKREEIRLSIWLERKMRSEFGSKQRAKEEIFARYASFVYMGRGQYGLASASDYYFGRPLGSLTDHDADIAAALAGVMKAPRDYAPTNANSQQTLRRRNQVLALMATRRVITAAEKTSAQKRPLGIIKRKDAELANGLPSSAVVEHMLDELHQADADLGLEDLQQGRLRVFTTVDRRLQRIVADALERGLKRYEDRHPQWRGQAQGSVVVLSNRDGAILAEAGGRERYNGRAANYGDLNRVRQSLRQPGSTMKPIVYLAALRSGQYSLDSIVDDQPTTIAGARAGEFKSIANYDGLYKGPIALRQALAESRNTIAIQLATSVGVPAVQRTARSLGVSTQLQPYLTTALGASELNLLELATAYRTIATGTTAKPFIVRRIARTSDEIDGPGVAQPQSTTYDASLAAIREGLRGVVLLPTGTAHSLASLPIPVMGKTGTTNDYRDALFVGSTYGSEGITIAVRIGFDDNRSLGSGETGGRVAMPVFRDIIVDAYSVLGKPPAFPSDIDAHIYGFIASEANNKIAEDVEATTSAIVSDPAAVFVPPPQTGLDCAHHGCKCAAAPAGQLKGYCSERCKSSKSEDKCGCKHEICGREAH